MRMVLCAVVVLAFSGFATAQEKIDAKKLLGKWEPAVQKKDEPKVVVEYAEKGKLTVHVMIGDKAEKIEGTYKVDGNKIEVKLAFGGKDILETLTVIKLTDDEAVTKDSKGKEETMKKVKK
ncbi:MAG: TIGR03066 family protein [Gemmataceae bacterium]